MVSQTVSSSASCSAATTRSKTRMLPGAAAAFSSVSTRADPGSYGRRCPPANHSAAVTSGDPAVLFPLIGGLPRSKWTLSTLAELADALHFALLHYRPPP